MKKENTRPEIRFIIYGVVFNLILSIFLVTWNLVSTDKGQIVYVDAIKLLSKYKGLEDARKALDARSQTWQSNLDTLKNEVDQAVAEYKEIRAKGSAREKQLMEELIKTKQEQLYNYELTAKEQFQKQDQEMSKKLLDKVNEYIKRYGEQQGYTIILAATQYGNIAYGDKALDITEKVLEGLNDEYQKVN